MSFVDEVFPACVVAGGYSAQPDYSTSIVKFPGGQEDRNRNWQYPLISFSATIGPAMEDTVQELLEFWHAMGGDDCGFLFLDYSDYKSCRVGQTPTAHDAPILDSGVSPQTFQLTKRYQKNSRIQLRKIIKPIPGSVVVANAAGTVQPTSSYSLDTSTGIIIPNGTFVGVPTTWGGEFYVPVRFDSAFPVDLVGLKIESVTFALIELRNPA